MQAQRRHTILGLLGALTVLAIVGAMIVPRIAQDPAYHQFADSRAFFRLPNFWNVISNVAFLPPAVWGLSAALRKPSRWRLDAQEEPAFILFCVGVGLVAIGSAYYHLRPNNGTLVWDRLPMTIAFTSLLAMILIERTGIKRGQAVLWLLIAAGLFSVAYWHYTEQAGAGDLRPYGVVQFLPMILIPLLIWLFPARYTRSVDLGFAVALYILAKLLEHYDAAVYAALRLVSGHTLKHFAAAAACYVIIRMVLRREPLDRLA